MMAACCLLLAASAHAQAPVADFSGTPLVGAPSLSVSFTDASTGSPTSWEWDFGDSGTSAGQNPSHSYTSAGSYAVSLTAANAGGQDTEVKPDYVTVTTGRIVNVSTGAELDSAVWNALDGDTIVAANGTYTDSGTPFLRLEGKNNITIRGASGDPADVILQGQGWASKKRNDDILWLWGCHDAIVSHMTFEECNDYGIKLENTLNNGQGLQNITISHCDFKNIGTRMIKGTGADQIIVDTGIIHHCNFENTKIPPGNWHDQGNYISAIDCMVLHDWIIRDNVFKNIKGNSGGGRGAIFVWVESVNVLSERNVFTGCDRSIAYGNPSGSSTGPDDHHMTNGMIRNNFIVNGADTGIELCWINGCKVYHNTVLTDDPVNGKGIHYHYNELLGIHIASNIVRGMIYGDPGDVTVENNITSGIEDSWFEDVSTGDLHLTALATPAIDQVDRLADCVEDFDQETRPTESGMCDIGGDERLVGPQPPVAEFSGNPTEGNVPLTVYFTDLSSGSPTSWDWTFGDGGSDTVQDPSHEYTSTGDYTVSLTAYNAEGQDTETKPDYISVTEGQPPVADFVGSPTSGSAPLDVDFTDLSTNNPTSWYWTFGDGGTSTEQSPGHTYTSDGDYTVGLTAYNAYGQDTETKPDYISVSTGGEQDYFCGSIEIEKGTILSGDHNSVHASDDVYLEVQSVKSTGKYTTQVIYYYNTGLSSLSSLTVTSESHPSHVPQRQRIWLWNFTTSQWVEEDVRDITSTSDETTVLPISSPSPYLSGSSEVRLRIRQGERLNTTQWTHYIDLVKITAG
jgi:PKD repeat protein